MLKKVTPNGNMSYFTTGKTYEVLDEDNYDYKLKDDDGDEDWHSKDNFEETNIFKSYEVAQLLSESMLKDGDEITAILPSGGTKVFKVFGHSIRDMSNREVGNSYLANGWDYKVDIQEESVTFEEAIASGKRIKFVNGDNKSSYKDLDTLFSYLGDDYDSDDIRDIMQNAKWFIER